MSAFLIDTLLWTGALLGLVLLVRRPVAAVFGPAAAYALWALPMARLLLPPLVLPAWMAPSTGPAADMALSDPAMAEHMAAMASHSQALAQVSRHTAPSALESLAAIDWAGFLVPLWLLGAAVFLFRRYALYFQMRRELLAAARPMGEAGRVRLVETPAADGPVAFGVIDRVIALPPGFMAAHDRTARDLALAHELAHHRGRDLVCNMLVQPLFALHWFNPLGLLGWRALRRDQEAACDARVMVGQPRESRAAYAAVITRFAVQPRHAARLALAAPMACPVLGDRSIVQRLRSLRMADVSARRRWAGRALLGAAALALPMTGSISYARVERAPPAPPVPIPAALLAASASAEVAEPPRLAIERREGTLDHASPPARTFAGLAREGERRRPAVRSGHAMTAHERAELDADMAEMRIELERELGHDGAMHRELEEEMRELQREMERERADMQHEIHLAVAASGTSFADASLAVARMPRVVMRCRPDQKEVAVTIAEGGRERIFVCNRIAAAISREALASARVEIVRSHELSEHARQQALRSLDEAERAVHID